MVSSTRDTTNPNHLTDHHSCGHHSKSENQQRAHEQYKNTRNKINEKKKKHRENLVPKFCIFSVCNYPCEKEKNFVDDIEFWLFFVNWFLCWFLVVFSGFWWCFVWFLGWFLVYFLRIYQMAPKFVKKMYKMLCFCAFRLLYVEFCNCILCVLLLYIYHTRQRDIIISTIFHAEYHDSFFPEYQFSPQHQTTQVRKVAFVSLFYKVKNESRCFLQKSVSNEPLYQVLRLWKVFLLSKTGFFLIFSCYFNTLIFCPHYFNTQNPFDILTHFCYFVLLITSVWQHRILRKKIEQFSLVQNMTLKHASVVIVNHFVILSSGPMWHGDLTNPTDKDIKQQTKKLQTNSLLLWLLIQCWCT